MAGLDTGSGIPPALTGLPVLSHRSLGHCWQVATVFRVHVLTDTRDSGIHLLRVLPRRIVSFQWACQ